MRNGDSLLAIRKGLEVRIVPNETGELSSKYETTVRVFRRSLCIASSMRSTGWSPIAIARAAESDWDLRFPGGRSSYITAMSLRVTSIQGL